MDSCSISRGCRGFFLPCFTDGFFENFEGVQVVEKGGRPKKFVGPPSRNACDGAVCGDGDVRGKFLCAWGKEELVVGAAKDASGVGVKLDVYNLGVISAADVDEGVELDADRAF